MGLHPILGVQIDTQAQTTGLLVDAVMPGSIASRLGLTPGDILVEINATPLESSSSLHERLSTMRKGDKLTLTWRHGSDTRSKSDDLREVPALPTYTLVEGSGIPGIIQIGDTRESLEKALGPAVGEKPGDGIVYLAWPFHGIVVALVELGGKLRVTQFSIEYPLVCRTARGLVTGATRADMEKVYHGEAIDTQVTGNGFSIDTLPALGIQFRGVNGRITRVSIIPKPAPRPAASPR